MAQAANPISKISIREYSPPDEPEVKNLLAVLQDYVHNLEPHMLATAQEVFESYYNYMQAEIAKKHGKIFLAESEGAAIGFIACWVMREEYETSKSLFISDLVVLENFRGLGAGTQLIKRVEDYAKALGDLKFIKIGFLHKNSAAGDLYRKNGYADYALTLIKTL